MKIVGYAIILSWKQKNPKNTQALKLCNQLEYVFDN